MLTPLLVLTLLTIFNGYLFQYVFIGVDALLFWNNSVSYQLFNSFLELDYYSLFIKLLPTLAGFSGIALGLYIASMSYTYNLFTSFYSSDIYYLSYMT